MKAVDKIILVIAKDFSMTPGPRYDEEGDYSGQSFRTNCLIPKLKESQRKNCNLLVDLDGTAGYGTSFLEEAFGGLIREEDFSYADISGIIEFKSDEETYLLEDIDMYMKDAENEKKTK